MRPPEYRHHKERHGSHHHNRRDDLAGKLARCGKVLSHHLGEQRGQGQILRILSEEGDLSQRALQDRMEIRSGSMSELAAKLENKGLIVRVRDDQDKRKVLLSLTELGRDRVAHQTETDICQRRAELFSALSKDEQDVLQSLLTKLLTDWESRLEQE